MNRYDIATLLLSLIGAVVIGILAFSLTGCVHSTTTGNSLQVTVNLLTP